MKREGRRKEKSGTGKRKGGEREEWDREGRIIMVIKKKMGTGRKWKEGERSREGQEKGRKDYI